MQNEQSTTVAGFRFNPFIEKGIGVYAKRHGCRRYEAVAGMLTQQIIECPPVPKFRQAKRAQACKPKK